MSPALRALMTSPTGAPQRVSAPASPEALADARCTAPAQSRTRRPDKPSGRALRPQAIHLAAVVAAFDAQAGAHWPCRGLSDGGGVRRALGAPNVPSQDQCELAVRRKRCRVVADDAAKFRAAGLVHVAAGVDVVLRVEAVNRAPASRMCFRRSVIAGKATHAPLCSSRAVSTPLRITRASATPASQPARAQWRTGRRMSQPMRRPHPRLTHLARPLRVVLAWSVASARPARQDRPWTMISGSAHARPGKQRTRRQQRRTR